MTNIHLWKTVKGQKTHFQKRANSTAKRRQGVVIPITSDCVGQVYKPHPGESPLKPYAVFGPHISHKNTRIQQVKP